MAKRTVSVTLGADVAMPSGLIRRHGRYSIRRVIPLNLQPHYGRREIVRALGTADPAEARKLHALAWVAFDQEFDAIRKSLLHEAPQLQPANISMAERIERVSRGIRAQRDKAISEGQLENWTDNARIGLIYQQEVVSGILPPDGHIEGHEAVRNVLRGLLTGEGALALHAHTPASTPKSTGPLLPELIERWIAERRPTGKTINKARTVCASFYGLVGELPIGAITPDHVQTYKESLIASGCAPATGANKLNMLRAVIRLARTNRLIATDPCDGINITDNTRASDKRIAYDLQALESIFSSPVYKNGARPRAGCGEAAYWLPILSLYTGARLNELGQLRIKDIVNETYIAENGDEHQAWVIRIVRDEADGLRVKNENSIRRIPIHRDLELLDFLDYVNEARDKEQYRLFPGLNPDKYGNVTAQWSKWYGRYCRRQCRVTDPRMTFHSFRHTFKHYARLVGIAPDVQNEITGHETGDVGDTYGGLSYPLLPLILGINRYRIPGFILPPPSPR